MKTVEKKSMLKIPTLLAGLITILLASQVQAHDGHHESGLLINLWHLITQPDHLLVFLSFGVPASLAVAFVSIRKAKQMIRIK